MNDLKICFIFIGEEEIEIETAMAHIRLLTIPKDYEVEILRCKTVEDVISDAKYKVYLRPNSLIIDTEFISNILFIFNKYPKVGILGAIGSESIPTSVDIKVKQISWG